MPPGLRRHSVAGIDFAPFWSFQKGAFLLFKIIPYLVYALYAKRG